MEAGGGGLGVEVLKEASLMDGWGGEGKQQ